MPTSPSKEPAAPSREMERRIGRRALDLFGDHEDLLPDLTLQDWISALRLIVREEDKRLSALRDDPSGNLDKLRHFINGWSPDIEE